MLMMPVTGERHPRTFWRTGKLVFVAFIILGLLTFHILNLGQYLSFESLKANRDHLLLYTDKHYTAAAAVFIAVYCVTAAFSLPSDVFLTMLGGFLFGSIVGTIYVNIGATAGATLAFLTSRYLLRDWVESKYRSRLEPILEGFRHDAFSYLLTLRMIPAIPFVLVNLASGLTRVELGTYVRATSLGIIPASFIFAYAGRQFEMVKSPGEIISFPVLLAFTLLGLLALMPVVYRRITGNKKERI
jgi:uncharacterized membrane protein YdjX (TVP38/TMEM64 family)